MLRVLAFLYSSLLATAAGAQTGPPPVPSDQQPSSTPVAAFRTEVVVTAERAPDERDRLPVATSVLRREELQSRPALNLAHAVQSLPGFHLVSDGTSGLIPASVTRGFFGGGEAEYVTVLVDGVPIGDAESGVVDWRRVPAFSIGRVEGLRGPASAVYGDTALAGVIQVFTIAPTSRGLRVQASGGSFGSGTAGFAMSQPLGAISLQAFGSYHTSDGFRANSSMREGFGSVALDDSADSRRWTARASLNYSNRLEPGALSAAQLASDRATSDPLFRFDRDVALRGYATLRYGIATDRFTSTMLGRASARGGDRLRTLLLAAGLGDRADRDISSGSIGVSLENTVEGTLLDRGSGRLRFGLDASRDALDTTYFAVSDAGITGAATGKLAGDRWRLAGYATQSVNLGERLTVQAGLRWDGLRDRTHEGSRQSHHAWSPRGGAVVSIGRGVAAFGQISRAFKAPTVDQLFDPRPFPDFRGGTFLISTSALRPQRATNVEGGVRQSLGQARWEAVAYRMEVRDEIDFDPSTFAYANIGRSRHDGLEFDISLFANSPVAVSADYAWMRAVPDGSNRQLKNIPRHLFRPQITVQLPGTATVHVRFTATQGTFADDGNRVRLGDRSTIDLRAAKRFSRLRVLFDVLNLGNDRYDEVGFVLPDFRGGLTPFYYPAPGVSVTAGIEVDLSTGW